MRPIKFTSLWLAIIMLAVLVSACSGNKENNQGEHAASNSQASASTTTPGASTAPPKIHILSSHSSFPFAATAPEKEKEIYYEELKRISGYDISYEFLAHGDDFRQQLALRFASGDLADLVRTASIDWDVHQGAVDQNMFHELGPLIDQYAPTLKKSIPDFVWNSPKVSKNGKIYGIPVLTGQPADRIVMIRQDWLDKLNMPVPETLDDFLAFAEGVKKNDMNGDGNPNNEYALSLTDGLAWNDVFTGSFGVNPATWHVQGDRLEPDFIQPEMKEAIAFYKKLYDEGYIHSDFVTKKQADRRSEMYKGYLGSWGAATYQYATDGNPEKYIDQPDAAITMIQPPKGPRGETSLQVQTDEIYFVFVIPTQTKNPEEVIKYLEWAWASPDAEQFFLYGIKDHNYQEVDGKIVFDEEFPGNKNGASGFFRVSLNTREIGINNPKVIALQPDSERVLKAIEDSQATIVSNDALFMPDLKAMEGRPELSIGFISGNLFYDAFVKLVVGKEPLDAGFDKFVQEWKKRGGEAAIQEATAWYNSTK